MTSELKRIVLAYSGGLDTSVILKWLQETYQCDVITFTADIGQGEELEPASDKARALGAAEVFVEDLREEFVRDYVFPMFRANAIYEGEYLLGTSIARPIIAKRLVELATVTGADAIAHGATGKGNDQVRFELCSYALDPDIQVVAPWRLWDLVSREDLLAYAAKHAIPIEQTRGSESPFSTDANLLHISYEGGPLEDPAQMAPDEMWRWTTSPEKSPAEPRFVDIGFERGDIVAVDGVAVTPAQALTALNRIGAENGVGRIDIVENRYLGMKSRGAYETPGGAIMLRAHRAIESLTLDRGSAHLKDSLMPVYAEMIYNGYWFSPERALLQNLIDSSQEYVNGEVRLRVYRGNVDVVARSSDDTLFDRGIATFESDHGRFNQTDAEGFIKLNALRLQTVARRRNRGR